MKAKRRITEKKLGLIFVSVVGCSALQQSSQPSCLNLNECSPCDVDKVTEPLREGERAKRQKKKKKKKRDCEPARRSMMADGSKMQRQQRQSSTRL